MSIIKVERDDERLSLLVLAEFNAPIEHVWQLWADPRQLERWWGPPSYPATVEKYEFTPGGEVNYYMTGPDGERSHGWWQVSSIDPPRSLVFIDGWAHADGTRNTDMPTMTVQVQLRALDGRTRMELRFGFASREHMEEMERMGAFEGIAQSVGQMDGLLADSTNQEASS